MKVDSGVLDARKLAPDAPQYGFASKRFLEFVSAEMIGKTAAALKIIR